MFYSSWQSFEKTPNPTNKYTFNPLSPRYYISIKNFTFTNSTYNSHDELGLSQNLELFLLDVSVLSYTSVPSQPILRTLVARSFLVSLIQGENNFFHANGSILVINFVHLW